MKYIKPFAGVLSAVAIVASFAMPGHAYVTFGAWSSSPVLFYFNPQNADISADAAESALRAGMEVWNTESGSAFRYLYVGRVNDTSTGYDNRNVAIFRNDGDGSTIARTYHWAYGTRLVDTDIIFYDAYAFFAGTSGCNSDNGYGVYIEDVAAHEFGHALGLAHSDVAEATMVSGYPPCSQESRTLAADDMAGAQALYSAAPPVSNTAPSVSINSPGNNGTFTEGTAVSFTGSANDTQEGNLTSYMAWTSTAGGQTAQIGIGGSFSKVLTAGTHVITATVTDNGGMSASRQVSITVAAAPAPPPSGGPTLSGRGYKVKGSAKVDLKWSGLTGTTSVDVYRNGSKTTSTSNDGAETDALNTKGGGSYKYRVCASGSSVCTNEATVTF